MSIIGGTPFPAIMGYVQYEQYPLCFLGSICLPIFTYSISRHGAIDRLTIYRKELGCGGFLLKTEDLPSECKRDKCTSHRASTAGISGPSSWPGDTGSAFATYVPPKLRVRS